MSVFSRIFTKAEESAEPEVAKSGEDEFRKKFAAFVSTKKGEGTLFYKLPLKISTFD